jgi:hypothetical protein
MPRNQFQRMIFALITVVITVHAYVFYSLYVINGNTFMQITGKGSVLSAINAMGGVSVLGKSIPVWAVVLIEFCFAYTLEVLVGSPLSFKLVCRVFRFGDVHPVIFETAIITATVGIMCPSMSFIAAILYYPYGMVDFNVFTLLANWLKLVCFNLPFAFFSQLLFIQPFVRTVFKFIFSKDIAARAAAEKGAVEA